MTVPQRTPAHAPVANDQRGLTLMEILLVIVLIGLMSAFAIPKLTDAMNSQNVQSARVAFVGMYAKARYAAIQSGGSATLTLASNVLSIQATNPVTGSAQNVGNSVDLNGRYGVTASPSSTWTFDSRGIGTGTAQTSVTISKTTHTTTIVMSAAGRVIQ